ncbi:acyl-CoA dehydrogenase family protein [Mumia sp. DW29H23]|uniref:acyl-CoA dehydrogenase family protein n=1 Tax=Mumia sp. DW29H23 TaxID=3421241 RepID=UPI003D69ECDD
MTATRDALPGADVPPPDDVRLENTLDRWAARTTAYRPTGDESVAFADEIVGAGALSTLARVVDADEDAHAVTLVRRVSTVSPEVGSALAAHVRAAVRVRDLGTDAQRALARSAAHDGLALGWAERVAEGGRAPGDRTGLRLAPARLTSALRLGAYVAPVDGADGSRADALVPAPEGRIVADVALGPDALLRSPHGPTGDAARAVDALTHAAVSLGVASRLLDAAAHHTRSGRPWSGRTYDRLIDDPYVIVRFGRLRAELHAALRLLDDTAAGARRGRPSGAVIAKAAAAAALVGVVTELPDLAGATSTDDDALWEATRAARTHVLSDSTAWNEAVVGQALLAAAPADPGSVVVPGPADVPVLPDVDAVLATAADVARFLAQGAAERDRDRRHPTAELQVLARTGLLGVTVPVAFGGLEAGTAVVAEVVRLIAAADASIAQILQPHFSALETIRLSGTPSQQEHFFAEALAGARFGNANAELGTKSAGDIRTRLLHAPDGGFTVDGVKAYTTGSYSADWIPVSVRDPAGNRASALVRRDAEGVEIVDDWSGIGQRTTASGTTTLDGVRVFEEHVIAQWRAGEGAHLAGAKGNIVHGAVNVGVAAGALEATHRYVVTKARPSKDLGIESVVEDPHVVRRFGRLATRLALAESALARAADLVDDAERAGTPQSISAATVAAAETEALGSEVALEIASELFALSGASSSRSELGLDRYWRDVRTHSLHDTMIWKLHQSGDALLSGAYYFGNRRTVF